MNRQFIYREPKQGSILVICLWTVMILSILGLGITGLVFQEIRFGRTYERLITSLPTVQGAVRTIFYLRAKDLTLAYDTWDELNKEEKVNIGVNNSYRYFFVDKNNSSDLGEVVDESALINLNLASVDVLARLPGMDEELAQAVVDSGLRPFSTINEVLLVKEITKDKFLLFKDLITIYGAGKVNINTASKAVLMALGLDEETADAILRFRRENIIKPPDTEQSEERSEEESEEIAYGIASLANLLNDLRDFAGLGLRQEQDLLTLLAVFDVKSEFLRFNVIPASGGQEGLHYSIVIHPPAKKVLSWSEH